MKQKILALTRAVLPARLQDIIRLYLLRQHLGLTRNEFRRVLAAFDEHYYVHRYLDVELGLHHPFQHYIRIGWHSHRNPSADFDSAFYMANAPDVLASGIHPFVHWVLKGRQEGRAALPSSDDIHASQYHPRVTAIVPNYNHAAFLEQRVSSILEQSYKNVDVLILDDCSTDNSQDIINRLKKAHPGRIQTDFNQTNSGNIFRQWQKGVHHAQGELVWICESDDFCESDFVEKLVPLFQDPSVSLAFGRIQFADQKGQFRSGLDAYREGAEAGIWDAPQIRPAHRWFQNGFGVNNLIANVGGCIWRNQPLNGEIWQNAQNYEILGDWHLYLKIAAGGQIAYHPDAVSYFRQHPNNSSVRAFITPNYYAEHERMICELRRHWGTSATTAQRFVDKVAWQYKHHRMERNHGPLTKYLSTERILSTHRERAHILMAFLGFHPGGGEFFPIRLANELSKQGVQVSMLALDVHDINTDMRNALSPSIPVYSANQVRAYGADLFLKDAGITLIHSHMISLEQFFFASCQMTSQIPYIVTLHGSYESTAIENTRLRRIARRIDHWIYLTERNLAPLQNFGISKTKFSKLPNAVPHDPTAFPHTRQQMGIPNDAVVFTLAARGVKDKGWRSSIQAFLQLQQQNPHTPMHLLLAGDGEVKHEQEKLYGNERSITFLGFQPHIQGLYRISDVALAPSRFRGESFPLSTLEALVTGTPVISTRSGESAALIAPSNSSPAGLLIEPVNDNAQFVSALRRAMEVMLCSRSRTKYAEAAALIARRYDFPEITRQTISIYKEYDPYVQ